MVCLSPEIRADQTSANTEPISDIWVKKGFIQTSLMWIESSP